MLVELFDPDATAGHMLVFADVVDAGKGETNVQVEPTSFIFCRIWILRPTVFPLRKTVSRKLVVYRTIGDRVGEGNALRSLVDLEGAEKQ